MDDTDAGRLLVEVGGIPDRELEKTRHEAEHLEKSPFAITFYLEKPKEEWERDVDVDGTTKDFFTDKTRYTISDGSDNRNLISMIADTLKAGTDHILASVEEVDEIQGQTRQHSRSNTPFVMKTTYNEVSTR